MKRNSKMFLFIVMLLLTGSSCFLMTSCQKDYDGQLEIIRNQLKAGENSYTELKLQITSLEERVTTIEKQIEDLQNGNNGGGCDVDCEAQLKELKEALETAKAELQDKINDLNDKIKGLQDQIDNITGNQGITDEELAEKLIELENKFQGLLDTLEKDLTDKINALKNNINDLQNQIDDLKDKINELANRIKKMDIIPDFNNQSVLLIQDGNKYTLKINVKVMPASVIDEMIEQKDVISIDSRKVTPVTRSAEAGPEFTVEKVEKYDEATLTVTASATEVEGLPSSVAKDLACQVAVVFNENATNGNSCQSGYYGVRFSPGKVVDGNKDYDFFQGNTKVNVATGLDLSNFNDITYQRNILADVEDLGNELVEIKETQKILKGDDVKASPKNDGAQKLNVIYSLGIIYDESGKPASDMNSYIEITTDGRILMKQHLNPGNGITSIEGYRVIVQLQANQDGYFYGKPAYVCIELLKK